MRESSKKVHTKEKASYSIPMELHMRENSNTACTMDKARYSILTKLVTRENSKTAYTTDKASISFVVGDMKESTKKEKRMEKVKYSMMME